MLPASHKMHLVWPFCSVRNGGRNEALCVADIWTPRAKLSEPSGYVYCTLEVAGSVVAWLGPRAVLQLLIAVCCHGNSTIMQLAMLPNSLPVFCQSNASRTPPSSPQSGLLLFGTHLAGPATFLLARFATSLSTRCVRHAFGRCHCPGTRGLGFIEGTRWSSCTISIGRC